MEIIEPLKKLSRDIRNATATLTPTEARYLVDTYYGLQKYRISNGNQVAALTRSGEPHETLAFFAGQMETLENQVKSALDAYSASDPLGKWARSVRGIGPVLAAGLLAHIDVAKADTAGKVWRFAGLDSTNRWIGADGARDLVQRLEREHQTKDPEKLLLLAAAALHRQPLGIRTLSLKKEGDKLTRESLIKGLSMRPWNGALKVLCWKIGESFVKVSSHPDAFYGQIYARRKAEEETKNAAHAFADQAKSALEAKKYGKETEAFKAYSQDELPQARIHLRACRYAVKLFLAHYLEVGRKLKGLDVPLPYAIAHLGHADVMPAPGFEA